MEVVMSEKHILKNNDTKKNILLIGSNCIENKFIQREIAKSNDFSFNIEEPQCIEQAAQAKISDIVLISYLLLVDDKNIDASLSKVLSTRWIVYDVPKDLGKKAISEIQLFNCINLKGIIYQESPIEHLTRCLKSVSDGDFWLPRKVMAQMLSEVRPYTTKLQEAQAPLTKREIQIFKRLIKGASNLDISDELFISESTVKTHVYNIYKKLKVSNRKEAIRKAGYISEIDC